MLHGNDSGRWRGGDDLNPGGGAGGGGGGGGKRKKGTKRPKQSKRKRGGDQGAHGASTLGRRGRAGQPDAGMAVHVAAAVEISADGSKVPGGRKINRNRIKWKQEGSVLWHTLVGILASDSRYKKFANHVNNRKPITSIGEEIVLKLKNHKHPAIARLSDGLTVSTLKSKLSSVKTAFQKWLRAYRDEYASVDSDDKPSFSKWVHMTPLGIPGHKGRRKLIVKGATVYQPECFDVLLDIFGTRIKLPGSVSRPHGVDSDSSDEEKDDEDEDEETEDEDDESKANGKKSKSRSSSSRRSISSAAKDWKGISIPMGPFNAQTEQEFVEQMRNWVKDIMPGLPDFLTQRVVDTLDDLGVSSPNLITALTCADLTEAASAHKAQAPMKTFITALKRRYRK